jgi:hypothetical protein
MSRVMTFATAFMTALALVCSARVLAHEMTVKGSVAAIETARVQVRTGEEKKTEVPAWYPIDAKTKIIRGKNVVTREQAKITVGERVVVIVDHESDTNMKTLEIRLAESTGK